MSGLLVVLPVIWDQTADVCVESMLMDASAAGFAPDEILVVDNSREGWAGKYGLRTYRDPDGHNLGVARAWNVGAREVLDSHMEYLVICSASMRYGPVFQTTWRRQLETFWGARVIEADGHSWHAIALHRSVFEAVGLFDELLWPAYFEANDFAYRLRMIGWEDSFGHVWFNALSQGAALHAHLVTCPADPLLAYMEQKWGGPKGSETWVRPFGDKPLDYFEDVPIPELAHRYGYGPRFGGWW